MLTSLKFRSATGFNVSNPEKFRFSGSENLRPKINLNYVERVLDI